MDFPSGSEGIYGRGANAVNMLNGTPWIRIAGASSAVLSPLREDPDPLVAGVAYFPQDAGGNDPWPGADALAFQAPTRTPGVSFRVWYTSLSGSANNQPQIGLSNADNTTGYVLRTRLNGGIGVYRRSGVSYTLLGEITAPVLTTNAWAHISFTVDADTGDWSVQREGTQILSGTDVTPLAEDIYFLNFISRVATGGSNERSYYKDLIVWDQGGSVNNTHPGPCAVYHLPVNSDVSSGWSRSGGSTDYGLLDETPPDDADFIYAGEGPIPDPSIMGFVALDPDVVAVRGIMSVVRARKTDGGDAKLQVSLSPNDTDWDDGADRAITTAFTYWSDISELSPDTAQPWSPIEVNNSTVKINRTL